jgi:hypothetical protein
MSSIRRGEVRGRRDATLEQEIVVGPKSYLTTQASTASLVRSVISSVAGRHCFGCITIARVDPPTLSAAAQLAVDSQVEQDRVVGAVGGQR